MPERRRAKEAPSPDGTPAPGGRQRARLLAVRHPGASSVRPPGGIPAPRGLRLGSCPRAVRRTALPSPQRRQRRRRARAAQPAPQHPQNQVAPGAALRNPRTYPVTTGAIFHKLSPKLLLSRERPLRGPGARVRGPVRHALGGERGDSAHRPLSARALPQTQQPRRGNRAALARVGRRGRQAERGARQLSREQSARSRGEELRDSLCPLARLAPAPSLAGWEGRAIARGWPGKRHSERGVRGEVADEALAGALARGTRTTASFLPPSREWRVGPPASCCLRARHVRGLAGSARRRCPSGPASGGGPGRGPVWALASWPSLPAPAGLRGGTRGLQ